MFEQGLISENNPEWLVITNMWQRKHQRRSDAYRKLVEYIRTPRPIVATRNGNRMIFKSITAAARHFHQRGSNIVNALEYGNLVNGHAIELYEDEAEL